jgi:hypothetical protein
MITTDQCDFYADTGSMTLSMHHLADEGVTSFPRNLEIKSTRTGRTMAFKQIDQNHPRFDEDGWDGEMQIYEPSDQTIPCNVKTLTLWWGN